MSSCLVQTEQRPTQSEAEEASRVRDQVAASLILGWLDVVCKGFLY